MIMQPGREVSKHFGIVHSPMIHIDRHRPQASLKSFYQEPSSVALKDIKAQLLIHTDSDCLLSFTHVHEYLRNNVALQGQGQEELGRTGITWTECLPAPSLGLLPAWIPVAGTRWCWAVATRWRAQPRLSIGCLPAQATHASAAHHLIGAALLFSQRCSLLCCSALCFSLLLCSVLLCIIATTCLGVHLGLVAVMLKFWTGVWSRYFLGAIRSGKSFCP